jgi:hypothetical protein
VEKMNKCGRSVKTSRIKEGKKRNKQEIKNESNRQGRDMRTKGRERKGYKCGDFLKSNH